MSRLVLALSVAVAVGAAAGQTPPPAGFSSWSFDELTGTNGAKYQGLIQAEDGRGIEMQLIRRPPGKPTITLTTRFAKQEIASVRRLNDTDRAILRDRVAELDPDGAGERRRMESLELVATEWFGKPGAAKRYDSDYFSLVSGASEEITRRAAVRVEQISTAFARFLPPTVPDARPTVVYLAPDREEYRQLLGPLGEAHLLNPAVFDPQTNRILCGSDLRRLGTELQSALIHHSQELASLGKYEAELRKHYKGAELDRHLAVVSKERRRVVAADRANGARFEKTAAVLFAVLYHEAFHAYAATFVYPPRSPAEVKAGKGTGALPRWLNEGLAQVFETAVVEAGELRVDHADEARLKRVKARLKESGSGGLVPLGDLLAVGKDAFLAHHAAEKAAADRAYLTSWALAYYLTLDRRVIGTAKFKDYLVAVNSGGDARAAFEVLVGQDLPAFEKDWHLFLTRLQPDGTLR
jgi:hypothetical protein